MKILGLLFIATTMLFSFNACTSEPLDPVNALAEEEETECTADCFFISCSIDCGSGGGTPKCSCSFGLVGHCGCEEDTSAPAPQSPEQQNNISDYAEVLETLESQGAATALRTIDQLIAVLEYGVTESEIPTYYDLVNQHASAVESMPRYERILVNHFYE